MVIRNRMAILLTMGGILLLVKISSAQDLFSEVSVKKAPDFIFQGTDTEGNLLLGLGRKSTGTQLYLINKDGDLVKTIPMEYIKDRFHIGLSSTDSEYVLYFQDNRWMIPVLGATLVHKQTYETREVSTRVALSKNILFTYTDKNLHVFTLENDSLVRYQIDPEAQANSTKIPVRDNGFRGGLSAFVPTIVRKGEILNTYLAGNQEKVYLEGEDVTFTFDGKAGIGNPTRIYSVNFKEGTISADSLISTFEAGTIFTNNAKRVNSFLDDSTIYRMEVGKKSYRLSAYNRKTKALIGEYVVDNSISNKTPMAARLAPSQGMITSGTRKRNFTFNLNHEEQNFMKKGAPAIWPTGNNGDFLNVGYGRYLAHKPTIGSLGTGTAGQVIATFVITAAYRSGTGPGEGFRYFANLSPNGFRMLRYRGYKSAIEKIDDFEIKLQENRVRTYNQFRIRYNKGILFGFYEHKARKYRLYYFSD